MGASNAWQPETGRRHETPYERAPTSGPPVPQKVSTVYSLLKALATTPAPAPSPSLRPGLSQEQVTPGLLGFLLTAFIVVLTALLIVDMVRRIRRVRYRAQAEEERAAAEAAAPGGDALAVAPGGVAPAPEVVRPDPAGRKPEPGDGTRPEVNGDGGPGNR